MKSLPPLVQAAALLLLLVARHAAAAEAVVPSAPASASPAATAADVEWPMYNQTYDGQRYSPLTEINASNVGELKEACHVRLGEIGGFGGSPVVIKGVMYMTFRNATVALNPVDCGVIWKTLYVPEQNEPIASGNRGVAYLDGRLFRGTGDGRLIALDAATGQELWRARPADPTVGEWFTAAPVVWDRKVFIGVAGSDFGIRGRILAFDVETGALAWQFNTVPQPSEQGAETWKGDSWQTGGGGTWSTATLDPATGELFVPVGNPAPDFFLAYRAAKSRLGQNLFTNSVVALDARSGKLQWHFQATPSDDRDLDQAAAPMLFDLGNGRKALAAASKDGYLRVVDRVTHKLVYRVPVTTIRNENQPVTERGVEACPGILGGVQWNGPAYDARNKSIVVGAVDWCTFLKRDPKVEYKRGGGFYAGSFASVMTPAPSGWITSVDAFTGAVRWKFQTPAPVVSAITPTAGGITFAGDIKGNFYAFDSADGKVLFESRTQGALAGGIITYSIGQKQYVAIASGNLSRAMWGTSGLPHIIIYSLGDASGAPGAAASLAEVNIVRGSGAFTNICRACHGEGAPAPSLKGVSKRLSREQLIEQVRNPRKPPGGTAAMPAFDTALLSEQQLVDLLAYLDTL